MPGRSSKTGYIRYQTSTNSDDDVIAIEPRSSKLSNDMLNSGHRLMLFSVTDHHSGAWNMGLYLDGYGLLRHDHRATSGCRQHRIEFDSHASADCANVAA